MSAPQTTASASLVADPYIDNVTCFRLMLACTQHIAPMNVNSYELASPYRGRFAVLVQCQTGHPQRLGRLGPQSSYQRSQPRVLCFQAFIVHAAAHRRSLRREQPLLSQLRAELRGSVAQCFRAACYIHISSYVAQRVYYQLFITYTRIVAASQSSCRLSVQSVHQVRYTKLMYRLPITCIFASYKLVQYGSMRRPIEVCVDE